MTSLFQGDKVIRETKCKTVTHLYGEVIFWGHSKNGRLMIVCEASDGAIFVSDPSHLEKVNAPEVRSGASVQSIPKGRSSSE